MAELLRSYRFFDIWNNLLIVRYTLGCLDIDLICRPRL